MKLDPAEIRRRNFITTFPYSTPVGLTYDTGDYKAHLDKAVLMADVAGFPARKAASAARGKKRGLGYCCYIEACGIAPSNIAGALGARAGLFEAGEVRVHPTGTVTIFTGSHSHGQGHETTFAQVVADRLGIPIENVEIVHGDTGRVPFGMGTYGSRSWRSAERPLKRSTRSSTGKKIAAHCSRPPKPTGSRRDSRWRHGQEVAWGKRLDPATADNFPLEKLEPGQRDALYDPETYYPDAARLRVESTRHRKVKIE